MAQPPRVSLPLLALCLYILPTSTQGPYHTGTTSWTLFQNSWPVREIFIANYSSTVHDSPSAWALDMYASWCGHCQRFAPDWKRLASRLKGWRHVIQFGALACSHPDAEQLCIDQGITRYPTLKLFPPKADPSFTGVVYTGDPSETSLRMGIVDFLTGLTDIPEDFPNLQPVRSTVQLLEASSSIQDRILLLLAENITDFTSESNYLGRYVILDVSSEWRRVVVRRVEAPDAANLGIREFPSLHRVNPADGALLHIASHKDRRGFVSVIKREVLQLEDSGEEDEEEEGEGEEEEVDPTPPVIVRLPDGVHDQDLESGVFYSLWSEVALHKNLRGARLKALQTYVNHLAQLLPVRPLVHHWLVRLTGWLSSQSEPITRDAWIEQLSLLETPRAHLPKRVVWAGCKSAADPGKRGYPCSLWTIFHALTVGAYNHPDKGISPKALVKGMREYIHRFFSCNHCRVHFLNMSSAINSQIDQNSRASGVLWLWRAHNKVNRRLHGDLTEDPTNPKMQFPAYSKCHDCHESRPSDRFVESDWKEDEVMSYLVDFYSDEGIIRDALPYTYKPYVVATTPPVDQTVSGCPGVMSGSSKMMLFVNLVLVLGTMCVNIQNT